MKCPRHLGMSVLAGTVLAGVSAAAPPPALLTIGQGWAQVREFFPPSGETEISTVHWTNPPPEIDLDTLQVWSVGRLWPAREWRWRDTPEPGAGPEDSPPPVWTPRDGIAVRRPARDVLDIELERPMSHRMGHSLTYRLPGLGWQAFYRVVVRGIGPESIQSVQVDLSAHVRIRNETPAAFPDARLSLTGSDATLLPPPKPFGLLAVNPDTPLSDLWLFHPDPPAELPRHYPLDAPADIPARNETEILFARVVRKPAQIVHLCHSDEIPAPTRSGGLPLRRLLLIPNSASHGLGFPLPPGEADLFLGAARGTPLQTGHVAHTPHPGTLQVDMGLTDTVRATRQTREEIPLPEGAWQSDHSILLENRLDTPVQVTAIEKPDTPMEWNLVRSSIPSTAAGRELRFETTVPPKSTRTITYRLRLTARNPQLP